MPNSLAALSHRLQEVTAGAAARVAAVHARPRLTSSGVIWRKGLLVTADHTVAREKELHVTLPGGAQVEARLKGRDGATNLALLEFEDPADRTQWTHANPEVGSLLLAIGRDATTGPRAAFGILSTASGAWRTWRGGQIERLYRLDLLLHPSASGGAAVDAEGHLVGVATDGLSRTSPLAIPGATVERIVTQLLAGGRVARAYLGVGLQPVTAAAGRGLIVLSVETGAAADAAGVLVGDILLEAEGQPLTESEELQTLLESQRPGQKLAFRIVRGGQNIQLGIELGERS